MKRLTNLTRNLTLFSAGKRGSCLESSGPSCPLDDRSGILGSIDSEIGEDFDPDVELKRWFRQIEKFRAIHSRGAQSLINPYIVERPLYGRLYRMIIGTEEGRRWYDNLQVSEAHLAQSLGMIGQGDIAFDCGCNQGFNALIYSDIVGRSGKVMAFDPYPLNIEISRFNAALNRKSNIEFVDAGLTTKRPPSRCRRLNNAWPCKIKKRLTWCLLI